MSLERFSNREEILNTDGKVQAITWKEDELDILQLDTKQITPEQEPIVELHLYSPGQEANYIAGGVIEEFEVVKNKIYINYGKAIQELGVERGQFEVGVNIYKNLLGDEETAPLYIKEISDDRLELHIVALPNSEVDVPEYLQAFGEGTYGQKVYKVDAQGEVQYDENGSPIIDQIIERPISEDIALNFGNNVLAKIINQKEWLGETDFVVRLYEPLDENLNEKAPCWSIELLSESYVDNINLLGPDAAPPVSRVLQQANFDASSDFGTVTETDFRTWNQLLDANTSTTQGIIDSLFSGSLGGAEIGIDYSGFQNFCHFSSAKERLANFKYKLGLVEYYDSQITVLNNSSGTDSQALQGNIAVNQKRRNEVIGSFDGFERWLYNEPTTSMFTHHTNVYDNEFNEDGIYRAEGGFLGAKTYRLTSWPKYLSGSKYYLHHTTSSIAEDWYNGFYASASFYDSENNRSLLRTIPEHIRLDKNNDQYELFVNMIGHHYDIIFSYIDNLTRVYKPEEQPKLGQGREILYQIAESLGWKLSNGKQASQLWQYKVGVDSGSGKFQTTGSLFSKSDEAITTEVWRRIVNNLPYLLKTKGTTRSIKALMNTYGIPSTLLSIREYGGPKVSGDKPTLIEDRFSYALNINSGSNIRFTRGWYSASIGDKWGIADNYDATKLGGFDANERPPDTIEFRFKPAVTQSMHMLSHEGASAGNVHWSLGIEHTGSYSGSGKYGRLFFQFRTLGGGNDNAGPKYTKVSDTWVPIYDGDFWNVRLFTEFPFVTASHSTPTVPRIIFQAQKASDYITGKVIHRTSGSLMPGSGSNNATAADIVKYWANQAENKKLYLGGNTGSGLYNLYAEGAFTGAIQEYREYMEVLDQATFDLHTLNPTSYVSAMNPTASFDTLVRHYPLGTNMNAVDHTTITSITSSHPNSTTTDFSPPFPNADNSFATAHNFLTPTNTERGNYTPVTETYYIQGVSLGGNTPRSQKIRLEDNDLIRRLSPTNTAETSRFDRAPIDTNKVGLFYSAADQINKEIFNHIGDVELDDYIGDPNDEFRQTYPELNYFSKEYWKKYTDKNDINAFLRVFNQFDFALFEQIKQLLPERVDEAMGLLVEPHALERAKVQLYERPEREPLHYTGVIPDIEPTGSGDILPLSGSVHRPVEISDAAMVHNVGTGGYNMGGNYRGILSGSSAGIPGGDPFEPMSYSTKPIFPRDQRPTVSGSATAFYVVAMDNNEPYFAEINTPTGMGLRKARFRGSSPTQNYWFGWNSSSMGTARLAVANDGNRKIKMKTVLQPSFVGQRNLSDKLRIQYDTYLQTATTQDIQVNLQNMNDVHGSSGLCKFHVRLITTEDNRTASEQSFQYGIISGSNFTWRPLTETKTEQFQFPASSTKVNKSFNFIGVHVPRRTNITVEVFVENSLTNINGPEVNIGHVDFVQTINKAITEPVDIFVDKCRPSTIFKKAVRHYGTGSGHTRYQKDEYRAISQSLNLYYSSSLTTADYRDDFFAMTENQRYDGCRIVGGGINVVSPINAINQKPVVEVYSVNPNQLVFTDTPPEGNPGNLLVR